MQENWIGKSQGVRFAFTHTICGADQQPIQGGLLYVFTTRLDTLMGVTFCAVAPEHPLAQHAALTNPQVAAFIETCKNGGTTEAELATQEKKGIDTGLYVVHPITGQSIAVWVGNYVLMGYGDGAVMGVPAHDERDFAFAKKYALTLKPVIEVSGKTFDDNKWQDWYADKQTGRTVHSAPFDGLMHKAAVDAMANALTQAGLGEKKTTWRLRDWGISRQRYWGTPIPIIHCPTHGAVPVPEKDLPVVLPENVVPDGSGNPLCKLQSFLNAPCPICGQAAQRETDTMDTFVDSSWYFLRYCDAQNKTAMVGDGAKYWMAMDQYIGGIEHAILHLLYARFWTKVMRDLGLVTIDEPFKKLLTQGMVLNEAFSRTNPNGGKDYVWAHELEIERNERMQITGAKHKKEGFMVQYEGWTTMSKSKNNGVDPQELIDKFGADTARLFVMFAAPIEQTLEWNDAGVEGAHRFLKRVWHFGFKHQTLFTEKPHAPIPDTLSEPAKKLRFEVHTVLRQINYDFERMQYNTVISGAMKLLNALEACPKFDANDAAVAIEAFSILLRTLYPSCPHVTWQLWRELGFEKQGGVLLDATWPSVDEKALVQDNIELMLQVNGKLRGTLTVPAQADRNSIEQLALAHPDFVRHSDNKPAKKIIVVPGRLVNVVV
jgi:leucyl-tRNA synthetase